MRNPMTVEFVSFLIESHNLNREEESVLIDERYVEELDEIEDLIDFQSMWRSMEEDFKSNLKFYRLNRRLNKFNITN
ncbi:MAG: hypothetical protein COC01_03925 [Bacteroidetes bacterium]|nr:MAG: hypothetical protein COC01_03925 [Bacteroidota bacterium]